VTRLFASDLHLDPARPEITRQFTGFLGGPAREAQALYLLGDLFEAWLGDDAPDPVGETVAAALSDLAASGVAVFVMQGNRDFLLGEAFCSRAGARFLPDPVILALGSKRVLVTHGDALCTGDASYQRLRSLVRDRGVQRAFLSLPLERRRALATQARAGSRAHLAQADEYITDVSQDAVEQVMRDAGVATLLHGHTHRPGIHRFTLDGRECTRIVLGDWHRHGSVLRWDEDGYELVEMPR
jgi:UDP-2,3-diacylglucosamine hydrolase